MAVDHGMCKNCGSLVVLDENNENCTCLFCNCIFPREEAIKLLENHENYSFPNEPNNTTTDVVQTDSVFENGRNEYSGDARIIEEHEVVNNENVIAGIVGAMLFSLVGGLLWFLLYQVNFFSSISGLVGVVCANFGYILFARKESKKGVVISIIAAVLSILIAWYLCLSLDCYYAFQTWYDNGQIDYTITYAQAVRIAYTFLAEPMIAGEYFKDLAIGLALCALGAFRYVKNSFGRSK